MGYKRNEKAGEPQHKLLTKSQLRIMSALLLTTDPESTLLQQQYCYGKLTHLLKQAMAYSIVKRLSTKIRNGTK